MRALLVIAASAAILAQTHGDAIKSISYSGWIDIGPGRGIAQLQPAEIADLRRCKNWTMYFQPSGNGIMQTFVAGMTMSNIYPQVQISRLSGETIFILSQQPGGRPTDTLHLSKDGLALTQMSPPFRPHTYLRCFSAAKAP